jgi:hypothetical protein
VVKLLALLLLLLLLDAAAGYWLLPAIGCSCSWLLL